MPEEKDLVVKVMENSSAPMILKPSNWFCGIGIKLINNLGKNLSYLCLRPTLPIVDEIPDKESKSVLQVWRSRQCTLKDLF